MDFLRLFYSSILYPFILFPIKILYLFFLGIIRQKKWKEIFDFIESVNASNRIAFWKTVIFNFRQLPRKHANKFPIHIYTGTQIISTSGSIKFEDTDIRYGMIRWGWFHSYRSQGKTRINNKGTIIFKGHGKILSGSEITVFQTGTLSIEDNFFIGENVLIYCQESIYLSKCVRISYQCDISDSDFHYCIHVKTGIIYPKSSPIIIGAYNWITNRTTIKKGTKTPHHLIMASAYGVLCKDYTKSVEPYSIMGGCPAKVIKTSISRVFHNEMENIARFDNLFSEYKETDIVEKDVDSMIYL